MRPNHNIIGNRGNSVAAPKPGDHYTTRNPMPIDRCPYCGQRHEAGSVEITRHYSTQGWYSEFSEYDCPNPPAPPKPPEPKREYAPGELQRISDHRFGFS